MAERERGRLKYLPINQVKEPKNALRSVDAKRPDYIELVQSVKAQGILNPILVREIKDDPEHPYMVVDGRHRYAAAIDAGLEEIPAQIFDMNDLEVWTAQVIGNLHKIETKPAEYARALQQLFRANPTMTKRELAQKVNKSTTWIDNQLKLTELPERAQQLVNDGHVVVSNAYALADLASVAENEVENYLEAAQMEPPNDFAHKIDLRVRQIKSERRAGRDPSKRNEYEPQPFPRRKPELVAEFNNPKVGPMLCKEMNCKTPEEGFAAAIAFSLKMDKFSIDEGRRQWEVERKKQEDEKKAREEKRREEAANRVKGEYAEV